MTMARADRTHWDHSQRWLKPTGLHVNTKMNGGEAGTKKYVTNTWVRLAEKLGMRSIILSRLELELTSESSNTMNRT
jgi:hypothetical protein